MRWGPSGRPSHAFWDCVALDPGTVTLSTAAIVSMVSSAAAAVVGTYGAIEAGHAQSAAASYQAQVAANNATIAEQNAQYATQAGNTQAQAEQLKTAQQVGAIRAAQAANGLDVNSGSALDVQSGTKTIGALNADTIRNNAALQAYGYQAQSVSSTAQSQLDTAQSAQALTAGTIGGMSSVLGGASSIGSQYAQYQLLGALNKPPNVFGPGGNPGGAV